MYNCEKHKRKCIEKYINYKKNNIIFIKYVWEILQLRGRIDVWPILDHSLWKD